MAKVVSKIAAVFYELVAARVSRTIHGGRNAASVFHGLLESMLFRTLVPGKWHFRRDSMDGEPFCLQCESKECKIPAQKLAFRECLVVRFRETCYLVVSCVCRVKNARNSMAKPRSLLFGARRCWREFFCTARAQCGASWYYQPVRLIESHFTFLAFSRDRSIAFPCVS